MVVCGGIVSVVIVVGPGDERTASVHGGVGMVVPSRQSSEASPIRHATRQPGSGQGTMRTLNSCTALLSINSWSPAPYTLNVSKSPYSGLSWPSLCKKTAHGLFYHILTDDK